jgi:hypothetical protein
MAHQMNSRISNSLIVLKLGRLLRLEAQGWGVAAAPAVLIIAIALARMTG